MSNKVLRMANFKLYIMRHGQTNGNLRNLAHGVTDEPLNDTGRAQAAQAAKALSSVAFSHAYSSDLRRASETARIVLGGGCWGDRSPLAEPALREQDDTSVLVVSHGLAILTLFEHMSTLCANPPPPLTMLPNTAYVMCNVSCTGEGCEVQFVKPCEWSHLQE